MSLFGEWRPDRAQLRRTRTVILQGEVHDSMAEYAIASLSYLESINARPVIVRLNSYGGSVTDGGAIVDAIRNYPCEIYTVADAAYSAAAFILALSQPGRRFIQPHGSAMLHAADGNATENEMLKNLIGCAKFFKQMDKSWNREFCKCTKYDFETFHSDMENGEEYWLTARDAKKWGVVDGIWRPAIAKRVYKAIRRKK